MEPFDNAPADALRAMAGRQDRRQKSIIVLDFGGQYAHLIARRVRQCGVFSEIRDAETSAEDLKNAAGIILSGGPQSVYDPKSPQGDPEIFNLGIPVLGICYGLQWMTKTLGGKVTEGKVKEYGCTAIELVSDGGLLLGSHAPRPTPQSYTVWMSHGDEAEVLPEGFVQTATSDSCKNVSFENPEKKFFAVQFHPEVTHTEHGQEILQHFVSQCDAAPWSIDSYAKEIGDQILEKVGDKKVFMLVSGGVDSSVAFTLLNELLGKDRVQGLLVDTGLMRKDEVKKVGEAFDVLGITNLRIEDASEEFFANLKGAYDPEEKRKIIGQTFLDVQRRVAIEMGLESDSPTTQQLNNSTTSDWLLGQGTIYPDTIETGGTKNADQIKTHHNCITAVLQMIEKGLILEPLRDLYKDEVRVLGEELGLPHELVWRHPFPGPGLGVRILCAEKEEVIPDLGRIQDSGFMIQVLPIKSVGVQGDGRSYRHAIALFSDDKYPTEEHWNLSTTIPNAHTEFNRVLMCTSHAEPQELIFSPGFITRDRADLLREADAIVDEEMHRAGIAEGLWQFPVVLIPCGVSGGESIVLRPVESQEAMTANAAKIPKDVLQRMTERMLALDRIDMVFYDLTHKPPGTIEWE